MFVIQTLPTPQLGLCTDIKLYVRPFGGAWYSFTEAAVVLDAGDWVTTDTYFGVIPTAKWARHTSVRRMEVVVGVAGDVDVEAVHNRLHFEGRVIAAERHVGGTGEVVLQLPDVSTLVEGHVFIRVRARSDGSRLRSIVVRSPDQPQREVRLGASITTFNRPEYVRSNVARLDDFVGKRTDLGDRLRLQVVDNARNLELEPTNAVVTTVFPNRNLGGAGGFARGLLELRDEGWATHVLFMDDDVTFEPEIVARIIALLSYATDDRLCIAGAMLREDFPHLQFEAGAVIRTKATNLWQLIGHNRDLSDWEDLLANDGDEPFDYGGWWCFAFPIDLTDDYPIPVFVRGDDICFGLRYCAGHLVSINGIGVWHQDFAYKNGPVAFFYESRNLSVMLTVSRPEYDATAFRKRMVERALRFASAFRYESARAALDGFEAYLDGPDRLLSTPADVFNDELRHRYGETLAPLPPDKRSVPAWSPPTEPLPFVWRAASFLTLGGHLLPRRLRRGRTWAVRAEATPVMAMLGAEELVFRHETTGEGFVARRDMQQFKAVVRRIRALSRRISTDFEAAAEAWRTAYPKMVSEQYWRDQFSEDGRPS